MNLARQYAEALYRAQGKDKEKIKHLIEALVRRGHLKLLPRIYAAYRTLDERRARIAAYRTLTPERARRRMLIELYKKLVSSQ